MKYKYEFEADDNFWPGDCDLCPFGYECDSYDEDDGYDYWYSCSIKGGVISRNYDCPLEEVK